MENKDTAKTRSEMAIAEIIEILAKHEFTTGEVSKLFYGVEKTIGRQKIIPTSLL